MTNEPAWVLLVGGAGVVGRKAAERLRQRLPGVPILVGGRDLQRAEELAASLGNSRGVKIDLTRRDLALPSDVAVSAVAMFVKDQTLNGQHFAHDRGAAFIDISSAAFEIGPQAAFYSERPQTAPILLASNWLAGASTFAALDLASNFSHIDRVLVSALLDDQDIGGAAAEADYVRQTQAGPSGLTRKDSRFVWSHGEESGGTFEAVDGRRLDAQAFGNLDVLSLSAATNAPDVMFQFTVGETSSRRRGEGFSHEIIIEIDGKLSNGRRARARRSIVHPDGQAPMTALSVSLAIESLIGRSDEARPMPGLYLPHVLVDPKLAVVALKDIGTEIEDRWDHTTGSTALSTAETVL